jgi:ketosteroid isomerase-like protein
MKQSHAGLVAARCCSAALSIVIFSTAFLTVGACAAQNNKKKKTDKTDAAATPPPVPVMDQIEHNIGEMLAAFQVGDADAMHKYYSDGATFVRSGAYEPPIVGFANYAAEYKRDMAGFQGIQIIRRNTLIFTQSDVAWATYQWEFASTVNGKDLSGEGQTTLVFEKVGDQWLIVHNHTSQVSAAAPAATQAPSGSKGPGL